MLGLSPVEIFAIAQMLAEDYGIKPAEGIHLKKEIPRGIEKVFAMKDVTTRLEIEKEYKPKQRMYIPRTIGKPCKKKFSRRK